MSVVTDAWMVVLGITLKSGVYFCPETSDICDQEVRVYRSGGSISSLRVEYVGACGSMGPYSYPCNKGVCSDGNAEFHLNSRGGYHWKNLGYPYQCEFRLKKGLGG